MNDEQRETVAEALFDLEFNGTLGTLFKEQDNATRTKYLGQADKVWALFQTLNLVAAGTA